jgi:glutamyl-tRNA synthetase/nondiscriminating glutamyl-tRNA synthetase
LDFPIPVFAHVSEIVGTDGKKLSKRAGATSVLAFRDLGYSEECFVNYMALLGWTSDDGVEYLPNSKTSEIFDIERCSKSPSTFDVFKKMKEEEKESVNLTSLTTEELADYLNPKSKLNWLSNKYIRDMDIDILSERILNFIKNSKDIPDEIKLKGNNTLTSILESIRVYLDRLSQAPPYISEFFNNTISIEDDTAREIATSGNASVVMQTFFKQIKENSPLSGEDFKKLMDNTGSITGEKGKNLFMPIRVLTTGKAHGLELPILFPLLGKEKLLLRMNRIAEELKLSLD